MMCHYWISKGIRPSVFYNMPRGELTVISAFFELEMERRGEILDKKAAFPTVGMM
jgi:hypothetical protein